MMLVVLFRNLLSKNAYNSDIQQQKRQQNKRSYYLKAGAAYRYIVLVLNNLKWAIWAINPFTGKCGQRQISTKFPHFIF